ncbi:MAG: DJ-1/PfpI family protein [Burkholderiales bacterium]|nr:DJ-1/PfpI family protein [Burkholderiales bacterium]
MARVVIALSNQDFDPTEAAVPWRILRETGHTVSFATPNGKPGSADPIVVTGKGLGLMSPILRADGNGRAAYQAMEQDAAFRTPQTFAAMSANDIDGLILPGGHAKGMKPYLESADLQAFVAAMFATDKPVGAICHGVIVAARARRSDGLSVLHGRRTTALPAQMELSAWWLTRAWMGDYYRTYPETVQAEVTGVLAQPADFDAGPQSLRRDRPGRLDLGFVVRDGNYLSARWPGDAHLFGQEFAKLL